MQKANEGFRTKIRSCNPILHFIWIKPSLWVFQKFELGLGSKKTGLSWTHRKGGFSPLSWNVVFGSQWSNPMFKNCLKTGMKVRWIRWCWIAKTWDFQIRLNLIQIQCFWNTGPRGSDSRGKGLLHHQRVQCSHTEQCVNTHLYAPNISARGTRVQLFLSVRVHCSPNSHELQSCTHTNPADGEIHIFRITRLTFWTTIEISVTTLQSTGRASSEMRRKMHQMYEGYIEPLGESTVRQQATWLYHCIVHKVLRSFIFRRAVVWTGTALHRVFTSRRVTSHSSTCTVNSAFLCKNQRGEKPIHVIYIYIYIVLYIV